MLPLPHQGSIIGLLAIATAPWAHHLGDLCAWLAASLAAWRQHRLFPGEAQRLARVTAPGYFVALAAGALAGAWLIGSLNSLPATLAPSHSVAGALAGGIVGVELWKALRGIRGSTGAAFVLPMAVGLAVGRLGCLFSGLADFTYGVPSAVPWAIDSGDGIGRHPVQLYEALAMVLFAVAFVRARRRGRDWATRHGFHAFVIGYALQRFCWEFLKPYPKLLGPFNLFHLICGGLVLYGMVWWRRDGAGDHRAQGGALCVSQPDDQPVRDLP